MLAENIKKIYLGGSEVQKMYLGENLIYPREPVVDDYVMLGTTTGSTDFMIGSSTSTNAEPDCIKVHVVQKPDGNNKMYVKQEDVLKTPKNFFYTAGFAGDKIISIDKWDIDTKWVTTMSRMFFGCSNLKSLNVNVSKFDTSLVDDMEGMFQGCSSLTSLDISTFDTGNVTNMNRMFSGCSSLTSLDVSKFNTINLTNMERMFSGCSSLTSLDVSSFDTGIVTNMTSMFDGCTKLNKLYLSKYFFYSTSLTEYDFSDLTAWTDAESLAKFVEAITARDGAGKTVILSIETQNALTDNQKSQIQSKHWTIS